MQQGLMHVSQGWMEDLLGLCCRLSNVILMTHHVFIMLGNVKMYPLVVVVVVCILYALHVHVDNAMHHSDIQGPGI